MVQAVYDSVDNLSAKEMIAKHGAGYVMNKRKIEEVAEDIKKENKRTCLREKYEKFEPRIWQQRVMNTLDIQTDRQILFVVDYQGGRGKTELSRYLVHVKEAVRFENGKSNDIKYLYKGEPIVCFDLCRSSTEHINYEVIESIKNGIFNSYKYQSEMRSYDSPKVVCFMNEMPKMEALSADRYQIDELMDQL